MQQLSKQVDHVGDHVGPMKQRVTLLLRVNLRDDDLPGCSLIEELHHRLRTQHCRERGYYYYLIHILISSHVH